MHAPSTLPRPPAVQARVRHRGYEWTKRAIDVTVAAGLLVFLAPAFALVALAVKLGSPGPVLHIQERWGEGRRPFRMAKFRSMHIDGPSNHELAALNITGGPTFKAWADPRMTRVGRVLRKTSLDELPQLWHVLTGEMTLVGPRPLVTPEATRVPEWAAARHLVKPGLTGLWQVSGRSALGFVEWMELDLEYVERRSLCLDLAILLRTPIAVLTGRGAC